LRKWKFYFSKLSFTFIIILIKWILKVEGAQHSRRFTFDSAFDVASIQEEVFHYSGIKRLVDMSIEGYGISIFNYRNKDFL
jgi:hypothetical protein